MSAVEKSRPVSAKLGNLVFGLGDTGLSVARYLKRKGVDAVFVDSRNNPPGLHELQNLLPGATVILGDRVGPVFKNVDRIIASPGVADSEPLLASARKSGIDVVSDIELFVREADAPIIAVSGSNGKSTVTTLIALMCDAAGKTALAGANLGRPALDLLEQDKPDFYVL